MEVSKNIMQRKRDKKILLIHPKRYNTRRTSQEKIRLEREETCWHLNKASFRMIYFANLR
ncbi:hypothetical protein B4099_0899 [Heyndrickxia coagulans]|uniref:Uncharacterized protein n=1 Tax=Heyndrickxia coagulans TaxID=1398 RepID=A0A150KIY4_HEYCO|nr:hypothetical protein B4099_0899 [Heyndrickxia coagulans]